MALRQPRHRSDGLRGRVAIALVLLIVLPAPGAQATDQYDGLVSQLNALIAQRSALVDTLATADSLTGSLALADLLTTVRSPLETQARQASILAARMKDLPPPAKVTADPPYYRGAGPGVLRGAHMPASSVPAADAMPADDQSGASDGPTEGVPLLPPRYQSLGTAQLAIPVHQIDVAATDVALTTVAAQAAPPPSSAPAVIAPPWYTPTMLQGADAATAYAHLAGLFLPEVASTRAPHLPSGIAGGATRPTSLADVTAHLGQYQSGYNGAPAGTATTPLSPRVLPKAAANWTLSATTPISDGTTLQVQSQGSLVSGLPANVTYSVFTMPVPTSIQPPSPLRMSLDLHIDGSATVTATETLSDTTTIQLSIRMTGLFADPAIAKAVASEQAPLARLSPILSAGNAVYAQFLPLYQARAKVYQQAFTAAMSKNAVLEQAWWDRTQRWDAYQTALAAWKKRAALWKQSLPHPVKSQGTRAAKRGVSGLTRLTVAGTATPTPQAPGRLFPGNGLNNGSVGKSGTGALDVGGGVADLPLVTATSAVTPIFTDPSGSPSPVDTVIDSSLQVTPPSPSLTLTETPTGTPTARATDTPTITASPSVTDTASATATRTAPPTATPTSTATSRATHTPSPTATPPPSFTALPSATSSPTATVHRPHTLVTDGGAPSDTATALPTDSATATATVAASSMATVSATTTASPTVSAPNTATPADDPTDQVSATRVVRHSTATDTATVTATPSASETPTVMPTSALTRTRTRVPTATATPASDAPSAPRPTGTATSQGKSPLLPPGPAPAAVPPPGPQPQYVALPIPLSPLPAWVEAPIDVTPAEVQQFENYGVNARAYASMTAAQLIAGGALQNVSGYLPPLQGVITTLWGGSTPFQSFHPGIDIAGPDGTPVHAAADGIVVHAGLAVPGDPTASYGNSVVIVHNAHISTLYGHMQLGLHGLQVQVGQAVRQGQVIGYEGQTGWATGPHVHFEMRLDNVQFDPLLLVNQSLITG